MQPRPCEVNRIGSKKSGMRHSLHLKQPICLRQAEVPDGDEEQLRPVLHGSRECTALIGAANRPRIDAKPPREIHRTDSGTFTRNRINLSRFG